MRQQVREGFVKVETSEQSPEGNEEASSRLREKYQEKHTSTAMLYHLLSWYHSELA